MWRNKYSQVFLGNILKSNLPVFIVFLMYNYFDPEIQLFVTYTPTHVCRDFTSVFFAMTKF